MALLTLGTGMPAFAQTAPLSLWSTSNVPTRVDSGDGNAVELGVKFRSQAAGYILGVRFYKGSANTGTHRGSLWSSTGTLLASATFSQETATGWQQVTFPTPVAIAADTTYVVSYFAPAGRYSYDAGYFNKAVNNGRLVAPSNSSAAGNGLYRYGSTGGFPTQTYNANNYWVDVIFSTTAAATTDTTPSTGSVAPPTTTGSSGTGSSGTSTAPTSGLRAVATTGAIPGGSNVLTVADSGGFAVGDWVIVEIGQEPGQGRRGTRGVGGTWPAQSYPTAAAMQAATSFPNWFVWVEDTGDVYQRANGRWERQWMYYTGKAIPRSLQARITAKEGNILTLDQAAMVGVSGANVYLDVAPIVNKMIKDASASLNLPAGNFAVGGALWVIDKTNGFTLTGSGKGQTRFFSPKGVPSVQMEAWASPGTVLKGFTLQGNWADHGFGLNWMGSTVAGNFKPVDEHYLPQGSAWPRAIMITGESHRSVVQDVEVIDTAQMAMMVAYADEIWGYRISNIQNHPMRDYIQWQFQWVLTTGGGCVDCSIDSRYLISGFEAFQAKNVSFIRPRGVNAMVAMNGAGGWLFQDADLRFTAGNSDYTRTNDNVAAPLQPIIYINNNINSDQYVSLGGTVWNAKIVQEGYATAAGATLPGIFVDARTPKIRIEGGSFTAPDYDAATGKGGSVGISAWGQGTYVANFRVTGLPNPDAQNFGNIYVQGPCIVNGGGNAADPRAPRSIYFNDWLLPQGCN